MRIRGKHAVTEETTMRECDQCGAKTYQLKCPNCGNPKTIPVPESGYTHDDQEDDGETD
jgi:ribosomal protein L37E